MGDTTTPMAKVVNEDDAGCLSCYFIGVMLSLLGSTLQVRNSSFSADPPSATHEGVFLDAEVDASAQSLGLTFWRKAYVTHAALKEKEELVRLRILRQQMGTNQEQQGEGLGEVDSQSTHSSMEAASREQPGDSAAEGGNAMVPSTCFAIINRRSARFFWVCGYFPRTPPRTQRPIPCASSFPWPALPSSPLLFHTGLSASRWLHLSYPH